MNPWTILRSITPHHTEPADPDLLEWIKDFLAHVVDLGPWTVVAVLAGLIVLIPIGIMGFYFVQQRRQSRVGRSPREGRDS